MYIWLADITTSVYNCIPHTIHIAATFYDLGCDTRKPVFGVSDKLMMKPAGCLTGVTALCPLASLRCVLEQEKESNQTKSNQPNPNQLQRLARIMKFSMKKLKRLHFAMREKQRR